MPVNNWPGHSSLPMSEHSFIHSFIPRFTAPSTVTAPQFATCDSFNSWTSTLCQGLSVFHLPSRLTIISQMNDQTPNPILLIACWTTTNTNDHRLGSLEVDTEMAFKGQVFCFVLFFIRNNPCEEKKEEAEFGRGRNCKVMLIQSY